MRKIYSLFCLALLATPPVTVASNASRPLNALLTLGAVLDAPTLVWDTYGDALWTPQTVVTHDGIDAAQSGSAFTGASTMRTHVTGPGTVTFWWKVSSETNLDALRFYVGGRVLTNITGVGDWEEQTFAVPAGSQELKWKFKNKGTNEQDRAWVDQVRFAPLPPTILTQPASRSVNAGTKVTFKVKATGAPPLSYQWQRNGVALTNGGPVRGATNASLTLTNVQPAQEGNYSVVVTGPGGSVTSSNALLTVTPILPLAEALDTPDWVWTTSDSAPWVGQSAVTHDGVDAARSGTTDDEESSSLKTTVMGPGTVTFWWKLSSETNLDALRFYVGDSEQARLSGEIDWQEQTFAVPAGSQELKWKFKNEGTNAQVQAWVDQVRFVSAVTNGSSRSSSPMVAHLTVSRGKVVLTWGNNPSKTYQVSYKDSLSETEWKVLPAEVSRIDSVASIEDSVSGSRRRFYRIVEY